jgi:hypothetical protein
MNLHWGLPLLPRFGGAFKKAHAMTSARSHCFSRTAITQVLNKNGLALPYGHLCKMAISSLMIVEAFTNV